MVLSTFLVFPNNANRLWGQNGNNYYACPKAPKFISPDITLSPFQVSSDSQNNSERELPLVVIPISRRTFKTLDMHLLPSREVCILGNKLKNFVLPQNSQFAIMVGIAIWFSPCLSQRTNEQRLDCIELKFKSFESVNITTFKTFVKFLARVVQNV